MVSDLGFISLLLSIGGVAVICVFVLLSACEEITCAFGPLDLRREGFPGERSGRRKGARGHAAGADSA